MSGYLSRSRVFETGDIDEANLFVNQIWEKQNSTLVKGSYGLRWNHVELDRCGLTYAEHDCYCDLRAQGPLSDQFRVYFHLDGAIEHTVGRRVLLSNPQQVAIHVPGADLTARIGPFKFLQANLNGEFVRTALKQRFRKTPAPEDWVGGTSRLRGIRDLPGGGGMDGLRDRSPGIVSLHKREAAPSCRAHAAQPFRRVPRGVRAGRGRRHALDQRDAGADGGGMDRGASRRADGVEEVANAVGVGVRSLQLSFQRARGYSPTQAIYQHRLERARKELLSARPDATVTSIAADLGIFELGRFAKRYRERFGETPSQTLMRPKA